MTRADQVLEAKRLVWNGWHSALSAEKPGDAAHWRKLFAADTAWHGSHPLNDVAGLDGWLERVLHPLLTACPDLERRDDIFIGGVFKEGVWVCATGHLVGTFVAPWLGFTPTRRPLFVRYGEFSRVADGRIVESYVIYDLPDVMHQAGAWPFAPSLGVEGRVPGPGTRDGVRLEAGEGGEAKASLALVEAMIGGLMSYDGRTLASMGMKRFWHPKMMWYGPAGIGTARTLRGFEDHHQKPFLAAFPDRVGGDHKARVGDGAYVASTGWPSVRATHLGGGFLGLPPTGKRIGMRVMDFWRREGELLRENWVFIDLPELLLQMGIDVLERARVLEGKR